MPFQTIVQKIKNWFSPELEPPLTLTVEECRDLTLTLLEKLCAKAVKNAEEQYDAWHLLHTEVYQHYVVLKETNPDISLLITSIAKIIDYMDFVVQCAHSDATKKEFHQTAITLSKEFSPIAKHLKEIHEENKS